MKRQLLALALGFSIGLGGTAAPALANGGASTRTIILSGIAAVAAAVGFTRAQHRARLERQAERETRRRQQSYRAYFYRKYGYYPTAHEVDDWYEQTYGVHAS